MIHISDQTLEHYIQSDIPYGDLTTYLQEAGEKRAVVRIFTREAIVVACSEEASRIAQMLGCQVIHCVPSSQRLQAKEEIIAVEGSYEAIHQAWRLMQILLEYSCKMATYAANMKAKISAVNPACELLTTRKSFPFAKAFCIKSVMSGGAMVHRLGLSESILFFDAHRIIYKNDKAFYDALKSIKQKVPEKKIVVESDTMEDAKALMQAGVAVLQIDKCTIEDLVSLVSYRDEAFPEVSLLAAGGIRFDNCEIYAKTGIDGIVTSAVYTAGMADLGSKLSLKG